MTAIRSELETKMMRRVRRHMLTSFGGLLGAIAVMVGVGFIARAADLPKPVAGVGIALAILLIPVIGFTSTLKNLRCPACEGGVGFQVSANFSLMGASASKKCRHCGAKIFPDGLAKRMLVMVAIGMGLGFVLGIIRILVGR